MSIMISVLIKLLIFLIILQPSLLVERDGRKYIHVFSEVSL